MKNYTQYRSAMKTGDVIAFSGKGRISELIKWKTGSEFSHVGMVLDTKVDAFGKTVMLVESTSLVNLPDAETKELIKGVQLHVLSNRLESYDGSAWWLPLKKPLAEMRKIEMQRWLRSKHSQRTPYDSWQALGAGADFFDRFGLSNATDFSSLFCSELVTKALQIADCVPSHINPSEQTPEDVARFGCFEERVAL